MHRQSIDRFQGPLGTLAHPPKGLNIDHIIDARRIYWFRERPVRVANPLIHGFQEVPSSE